ncbi:Uncharacterised protein [uncultured archaeon]|nr:Uncharacterised protein [uncultured archaeon]
MKKQKPPLDAVAFFRETAKGMGKLRLHPHAEYAEELEERTN